MKDWWYKRSVREQLILAGAAVFLVPFLLFVFVLSPLEAKNRELTAANRALAADFAWLQQAVADLQLLQGNGGAAGDAEPNLARETEGTARARGLRIDRLQTGKDGSVQVWLKNVDFPRVARWFHDMEYRRNAIIQDMNITAARKPGLINVQARLQH